MRKLIIFGTGVVAQCCISYFQSIKKYEIVGCTVDFDKIKNIKNFSVPIFPYQDIKKKFNKRDFEIVVCVGYSNNNLDRQKVYERIKEDGWSVGNLIPNYLESGSFNYSEGTIIFPGSKIQPFSKIGVCSIIWPGSVVGHHAVIGDFTWLASNCAIGGYSKIGHKTFIGLNSTISDSIDIGHNNIIGAGTFISKNTKNDSVYIRQQDEKYNLTTSNFVKLSKFGNMRDSY